MQNLRLLKIGLIEGGGTGKVLIDIFKKYALLWGRKLNLDISFTPGSRCYSTYYENRLTSTVKLGLQFQKEEDDLYYDLLSMAMNGCNSVFRTALNAQVLYNVRSRVWAVKPLSYTLQSGSVLHLIRDQSQGFYAAATPLEYSSDEVQITSSFSKQKLKALISYSENNIFTAGEVAELWLVYKHHLLFNKIEKWRNEISDKWKCLQPNSATNKILTGNHASKVIAIVGNEVGDILNEIASFYYDREQRTESMSLDVLLAPEFNFLKVYQTLHGSADDLVGKNSVDPTATLKALSQIISSHTEDNYFKNAFDAAVYSCRQTNTAYFTEDKARILSEKTLTNYKDLTKSYG
jgi:isocitrate/isopropylmalate dehydrogenase